MTPTAAPALPAHPAPGPVRITGRLLWHGTFVLTAGNILGKLAGLTTIAVAAHVMSPTQFGTYTFALAFGAMTLLLADMGVDLVVTRELSTGRRPDGDVLGTALVMKGCMVAVLLLGAGLSLLAFPPPLRPAAGLAAVMVLAAIPGTLALGLSARVQMSAVAAWRTGGAMVTLACSLLVLATGADVMALVTAQLLGAAVTSLALAEAARRRFPYRLRVDHSLLRRLVRQVGPLTLILGATFIAHRVDLMMLAGMASADEVGKYAVAVKMLEVLNLVVVAVAAVSLPAFAVAHDPLGRLAVTIRCTALALFPVAAVAGIATGWLLGAVYGARFVEAGTTLTVLVAAHCFAVIQLFWHQVLISQQRISALAALAVSAAIINVALNLVLIPMYGGLGAAWASLISYGIPVLAAPLVPELRPFAALTWRATARPAVAALLIWAVTTTAMPRALCLLAVPVALLVTRSVSTREIRSLATVLRRRAALS
jgi:O-antigen/teichoic acid export membrane protein